MEKNKKIKVWNPKHELHNYRFNELGLITAFLGVWYVWFTSNDIFNNLIENSLGYNFNSFFVFLPLFLHALTSISIMTIKTSFNEKIKNKKIIWCLINSFLIPFIGAWIFYFILRKEHKNLEIKYENNEEYIENNTQTKLDV